MAQRIIITHILFFIVSANSTVVIATQIPYGLDYFVESDQYCIYWHYQGVNQVTVQTGESAPDGYIYVSREFLNARAGITAPLPNGAAAIESVEWYLWGTAPAPDWVGSPTSPFVFALYQMRPNRAEDNAIWLSGEVAAQSVPSQGGWITFAVQTGIPIPEAYPDSIFVEFRWLPETPASPLPGVTTGLNSGITWYTIADTDPLEWQGSYYTDLMLRVIYNRSDLITPVAANSPLPDSFQVNLWDNPEAGGNASASFAVSDSLHLMIPTSQAAGRFVSVAAWNDGILSPKSKLLQLDVTTEITTETDSSRRTSSFLINAFPNPFNAQTTIVSTSPATMQIFDILGRRIRQLEPVIKSSQGEFCFEWDGRDDSGQMLASGVYIVRQQDHPASLKLILLK